MKVGDLVRYNDVEFLEGLIGIVVEKPFIAGLHSMTHKPRRAIYIRWINGDLYDLTTESIEWVDQLEAVGDYE